MCRPTRAILVLALMVACGAPPEGGAVRILPDPARTTDDLTADLAEQAVPHSDRRTISYAWTWYVDEQIVTDLQEPTVPASRTAKGETWRVVAVASDGRREGEAFDGQTTIQNSPPEAVVGIAPTAPTTVDPLVATATEIDADGDSVSFTWSWARDGQAVADLTAATVPAERTARGQRWSVTVVPNDGEVDGEPATAEVVIQNTAPVVTAVVIEPDPAFTLSTLSAVVDATDIDGDDIQLSYRWLVEDVAVPDRDAATLPGSAFVRGQLVAVEVTPTDGVDTGEPVRSAAIMIVNTPPVVASATISPSEVDVRSTVNCIAGAATDDDGDDISLSYAWLIDGSEVATGTSLSLMSFARGQAVVCRITPNDGLVDGTPVLSAAVTIGNSPPTAPEIAIEPGEPSNDDALHCEVVSEATDPDGDALTYRFTWTRDDEAWTGSTDRTVHEGDTIRADDTRPGQVWSCAATASDGLATGPEAESEAVEIALPDLVFEAETYWILPEDGTSSSAHAEVCAAYGLRATEAWYTVPGGWSQALFERITAGLGLEVQATGCCVPTMWCYSETGRCHTHSASSDTYYNWGWVDSLGQGVFSCVP